MVYAYTRPLSSSIANGGAGCHPSVEGYRDGLGLVLVWYRRLIQQSLCDVLAIKCDLGHRHPTAGAGPSRLALFLLRGALPQLWCVGKSGFLWLLLPGFLRPFGPKVQVGQFLPLYERLAPLNCPNFG